jgi:hypothetical protein
MKKQLFSIVAALSFGLAVAQPSPSWPTLQNTNYTVTAAGTRYLDAVDANVVWTCGYDGFNANRNYNWYSRSINGGANFVSGNIFADTNTWVLSNMEGVDANTAWVAAFDKAQQGMGGIFKTTNSGGTWVNMTAPGMYTNVASSFCNIVSFLTPNNGITMGDPVNGDFEIWTTSNGGVNWTPVPAANIQGTPISQEFAIVDLYDKVGPNNLWFGTNKGRIYYTTNSGSTWSVTAVGPPSYTVTEIAFASVTNGLAFVAVSSTSVALFNTTDGGVSWNWVNTTDPDLGKNDLCGIPGTNYFASVQNNPEIISYSTDNGMTWTSWGGSGIPYLKIDFVNQNTAWAGTFSDQTNAALGGIWKYSGIMASFDMPTYVCKVGASATVQPTNNSAGPVSTYTWSAANSVSISSNSAASPVLTFTNNGIYTVTLTAASALGATVNFVKNINVLTCTSPTANFNTSPANLCNNVTFSVTNNSGGAPTSTYVATTTAPNSTVVPGNGTNATTFKFAAPGIYSITITASNIYSTSVTTKTIEVKDCSPQPTIFLDNDTLCLNGLPAVITASQTTIGSGVSYAWSISPNSAGQVTVTNTSNNGRKFTFNQNNGVGVYTITLVASNVSGTTTTTYVVVVNSCNVGINEAGSLLSGVSVYPNPAHGQLNVVLSGANDVYTITMTNLVGAVVFEEKAVKGSKEVHVNLVNKSKGVYFLSVEAGNAKTIKKIIVE